MKYLILFLISFNLHAQVVICGEESVEQVNACSLNDKLPMLIHQHYPVRWKTYSEYTAPDPCVPVADDPETLDVDETVTCPAWEPSLGAYTFLPFNQENPQGLYERLLMDNKPQESELVAHLDSWKAERIADVNFRLRVEALPHDIRPVAEKCGLSQSNLALLIRDIRNNRDEVKLSCLESKIAEVEAEIQAENVRNERLERGRRSREFSNLILDLIAGFNIERQLTNSQTNEFTQTFRPITNLLQANRYDSAKDLITELVPDGTIVTQDIKDAILSEYTRAGF